MRLVPPELVRLWRYLRASRADQGLHEHLSAFFDGTPWYNYPLSGELDAGPDEG